MMWARWISTGVLVLAIMGANAQGVLSTDDKKKLAQANELFLLEDWYVAMLLYQEVYAVDSTNAEVNYGLGTCYINTKGMEPNAIRLLEVACYGGITEAYFELARAYHHAGRFEEARKAYQYYKAQNDKALTQEQVDRYLQITRDAIDLYSDPQDVKIENLGPVVNSEYHEYVPIVTANDSLLFFTSRRPGSTGNELDPNDQYFEDVYYSGFSQGAWGEPQNMGPGINTNTHDATVGISANGNVMILYRTNENLTGGDLYLTEFDGMHWSLPEKLGSGINSEYQEPSACLSEDENTLYFSSNRPGGFGGRDLYRIKRLPTGAWGLPQNLGASINTAQDEDAPFLHVDGLTLYFSSKGHNTIGGYDIFHSTYEDGVWSVPENLGYPINTVDDDIYFSLNANGTMGYYSSERADGYGGQDLYKVFMLAHDENLALVKGNIVDAEGNGIKAKITLIDENTRKIQGIYTASASNGKYIMIISPETPYQMIIEAEGYHAQVEYLELTMGEEELEQEFTLESRDE